jgi:integral membrane protein (TIGR00529 family)
MAVLKFSLVAFLLILLIKKKFDLGLSLILSAFFLGLMFAMGLVDIGVTFLKSTINPMGVLLLTAVLLIIYLSELMKKAGRIKVLVSSLRKMLGDPRGIVTLIPAMIGLLPIIGGAMISAPMVEEASDELKLNAERKTFLNYWFRHLWEYIFPTYPGVIFSAAILSIGFQDVAIANLPLTITAIIGGLFFGFKGIHYKRDGDGSVTAKLFFDFVTSALPLIVVIAAVLIISPEWVLPKSLFLEPNSILPSLLMLNIILLLVFVASAFIYRIKVGDVWEIARENFSIKFVSIVLGILIFKGILEATGAVYDIAGDFETFGIPPFLVLIILPLIIGASTGITMAFVGITFPILLPYFTTGAHPMIAFMLAYAGGYVGVLLSPVHLCLVLTTEYFKADLSRVYKEIIGPASLVLSVALLAYLIFFYVI